MLVCYNISLQAINVTIKISNFDINNKRSEKRLRVNLIKNRYLMFKFQIYGRKLFVKFMHYVK